MQQSTQHNYYDSLNNNGCGFFSNDDHDVYCRDASSRSCSETAVPSWSCRRGVSGR